MIIALVVVLGFNLWVILVAMSAVVLRRRSVKGRPGAFKGKIRITEVETTGSSPRWKAGYSHWVSNVLVWNTAPLLLRTKLVAIDGVDPSGGQAAIPEDGKRPGGKPVIVPLLAEGSHIELAVEIKDREDALGPFGQPAPDTAGR